MRTKYIIFGEALRLRVQEFKRNLPKNYSKSTKIAITPTACKFSKIFRVACPRTPLEPFLFVNQLRISSAEKKYAKKKCGNYASPFFFKFVTTPLSAVYQHFSNEESKFRSKVVAVKDSQDCHNHFRSFLNIFVCFLQIVFKKTLAKV